MFENRRGCPKISTDSHLLVLIGAMAGGCARPLLLDLLSHCSRPQLLDAARSARCDVPSGCCRQAALQDILLNACADAQSHKLVCHRLLTNAFTVAGARQWLAQLRRQGRQVPPSTAWGGQSRDAIIEAFIAMDAIPCQSPLPPRAVGHVPRVRIRAWPHCNDSMM